MIDRITEEEFFYIRTIRNVNPDVIRELVSDLKFDSEQSLEVLSCLFYIEQALFPNADSDVIFIARETDEGSYDRANFVQDVLNAAERNVVTQLQRIGYDFVLEHDSKKDASNLSVLANFNCPPRPMTQEYREIQQHALMYNTFLDVLEKIRRFYKLPAFESDVAFHEMYSESLNRFLLE